MFDFDPEWLQTILFVVLLLIPVQAYRIFSRKPPQEVVRFSGSTIDYWINRSNLYGRRAVLNLQYEEGDIERITGQQIQEIFPHVRQRLQGWEKTVLDFGCGPGRFSKPLADLVGGKTIATDPIQQLLSLAPKTQNVEYCLMDGGRIPIPDKSVDLLWICLVLGGIPNVALKETLQELGRVLQPGALICVAENTTRRPNSEYWIYRDEDVYRGLFDFASLERVHTYNELDEEISVFVGRKKLTEEKLA